MGRVGRPRDPGDATARILANAYPTTACLSAEGAQMPTFFCRRGSVGGQGHLAPPRGSSVDASTSLGP
eukprot:2854453-Pyramimonas_sp.AAC.1